MSNVTVKDSADFQKAMEHILSEYGSRVIVEANDVLPEVAKQTVKDLKNMSRDYGWKEYAKGWTWTKTKSASGLNEVTIHNKKPGLVHLLEKGHALRDGGRTRAFSHVSMAATMAEQELLTKLEQAVENV
jgi:hypothetical protein